MAIYSLKSVQKIPIPVEKAWHFFSNPANLHAITPAKLGLGVTSPPHGEKIYAGQIIEYTVRPLFGVPLYWMTEITYIEEGKYFVDEQRFGPYRLWHHQHHFAPIEGGTEMTDIVHYKVPLWVIGDLANFLFVKRQLRALFVYRVKRIEELFGKWQVITDY